MLVGIVKPETAKGIIHKFIEKDLYFACELFAWSSIDVYEEKFIKLISKIDIHSREYLLNLNSVVSFYIKVLDHLQRAKRLDEPISTGYMRGLGIAYWEKLDHELAMDTYKKAIPIYEQNQMLNHPEYAKCQMNLGIAYRDIGESDEAIQNLEFVLSIFDQSVGKDHPDYNKCLKELMEVKSWSKE